MTIFKEGIKCRPCEFLTRINKQLLSIAIIFQRYIEVQFICEIFVSILPSNIPHCLAINARENTLVLSATVLVLAICANMAEPAPAPKPLNNRATSSQYSDGAVKYRKFPTYKTNSCPFSNR